MRWTGVWSLRRANAEALALKAICSRAKQNPAAILYFEQAIAVDGALAKSLARSGPLCEFDRETRRPTGGFARGCGLGAAASTAAQLPGQSVYTDAGDTERALKN